MLVKRVSKAAKARRPIGLATRGIALITGLVLFTAAMAALTVWFGAQRESERHQFNVAADLAKRFAQSMGDRIAWNDLPYIQEEIPRLARRDDVVRVGVRNAQGVALSEEGGNSADAALAQQLVDRVMATNDVARLRDSRVIGVGAPIMREGERLGVALIIWTPNQFRFDTLLALAPFFTFLGLLLLVAVPASILLVRRTVAPLDALTRFAEKVALHGEATPIIIKGGGEFETLAQAFNQMIARLDASMKRIQQIAFVDPVTQLPNQERFQREIDFFILQADQSGEAGAVLVFEFQRLPRLMQTLDPDAARELLRLIAERFTAAVRKVDKMTRLTRSGERPAVAARLGAYDFAVFAPCMSNSAEAARFAQHLNGALDQTFDWRGHKLSLGAACGVAVAPRDGKDADAVIRRARMALGAAGAAPARLKIFTPSLDRDAVARLTMEREIRAALERNEFRAYFQPKVELATGRIESAEALARWVRPDKTIISPGKFIPAAEESGLIEPLSNAILREACWKAAAWARAGVPMRVAVNVSALQFRNERFADHVLQIVRHAGLPPALLELEITETVAVEDPERALRIVAPLRAAGVRLAIDDFGCGHSSLSALSKLPFDVIKIDQQFVRAVDKSDGAAIVEMILALAKTLRLEVVAEGVERREQAEFLAARGCRYAQGFLYGAAIPAEDLVQRLKGEGGADEDAA